MSETTINEIRAHIAKLADMFAKVASAGAKPTTWLYPETRIELLPGERYAGVVLGSSGQLLHHLVLMAQRPDKELNWEAANAWAEGVGGRLPTRQEQALLFANCKPHLKPSWHWSGEAYETDASYAWHCHFNYGLQYATRQSAEGAAVAVRLIKLEG